MAAPFTSRSERAGDAAASGRTPLTLLAAALLTVAAALIVADTLVWMARAWSAAPFWDQWRTVREYRNYLAEGPSWHALLAQHNEHRLVFPRLLFLVDERWLGGANRLLFPLLLLIQLGHAAMLSAIGWRRGDAAPNVAIGAVTVALLASMGQMQNLTWGFQVQFVGVFAAATGGFWLLSQATSRQAEGRSHRARLAAALALFTVAAFTMANGMFAFPVAIAQALALRARRGVILSLAVVMAAAAAVFMTGYSAAGSLSVLAQQPAAAAWYVADYIGNIAAPLQTDRIAAAQPGGLPSLIGLAGLALTAAAAVRVALGRERDPGRLALLAVIGFILAGAVVTAGGRVGFGLVQALSSRYVTPSAVFWAAHIWMWRSLLADARPNPVVRPAILTGCVVVMTLLVAVQVRAKPELIGQIARVNLGADALRTRIADMTAFGDIAEAPRDVVELQPFLLASGLSVYSGPDAAWLGQPLQQVLRRAPSGACLGEFDTAEPVAEGAAGVYRVSGWAWDRRHRREAAQVLLVGAGGRVIGYATADVPRADVARALRRIDADRTGWAGYARTVDDAAVMAVAVLPGGTYCELGRRPLASAAALTLADIEPERVRRPLADGVVAHDAAWTRGGGGPGSGADATQEAFGSWSGADNRIGRLTLGPFVAAQGRFAVAIATGPSPAGQSLALKDAATGEVLARVQLRRRDRLSWVQIQGPPDRALMLEATDAGTGWGQWMAVSAPREIAAGG